MTIKPIVNQKSSEKKETHGHNHQETEKQNHVQGGGRSNRNKTSVEVQDSQLRNDVYEDITTTRHRRSPHKILGRSKREHHHHNKRERERERGKICSSPQYVQAHNTSCNNSSMAVSTSVGSGSGNGGTSTSSKSTKQHMITTTSSSVHQHQQQNNQQNIINLLEETYSGYNSGDEHLVPGDTLLTPAQWKSRDEEFVKAMSERGFVIKDIVEDGACLFRAISLQIYGDQEMHEVIRQQTMDYIYQNREYFAHFVTEDINSYVQRKRNKDSHGNHIEIQAMSEIYNRPVELYCYETTPINIFNSEQINNGYDPLRLSYQRGSHYNAILDPYNASVGVGLGLAGYKPESQTREAIRLSEQLEIEKTMFEDKLKTTDWEATNEAIEEQIARESYLQWCRENMQKAARTSNNNSSNSTTNNNKCLLSQNPTSSTVTSAEAQINNTNSNSNTNNSNCETVTSCILNETSSSKETLQQYHNNNNNSNTSINNNPNNIICNKNNSDSNNCDMMDMSENQSSLLPKILTKKKDGICISGNGSNCNNNNNDLNDTENMNAINNSKSIMNECNSQCDSDDTDMSSTSSVDQYQRYYKTSTKKQHIKSQRKLKRRHKENELKKKRKSLELKDDEDCLLKRRCLEKVIEQRQQQLAYYKNEMKMNEKNIAHLKPSSIVTMAITTTTTSSSSTTTATSATITKTPIATVAIVDKNLRLPCTSKQADADCKPISQFYQSLLESSYTEDGMGQLSENEMLLKALEMSRMDFFEEQKRKFADGFYNKNNDDQRIDAPDEDSDTLST